VMVKMVERLLSIPPHTVAVERSYSRLGFMQGPRRANLSVRMLADMAMVNAWLEATDPSFGNALPRSGSRHMLAATDKNTQLLTSGAMKVMMAVTTTTTRMQR
jgi:hypothetical protein